MTATEIVWLPSATLDVSQEIDPGVVVTGAPDALPSTKSCDE